MTSDDWYELVNGDNLAQGDVINDLPIVVLPSEFDTSLGAITPVYDTRIETIDAIIMTQSCDLEQNKVAQVVVCVITELGQHPDFVNVDKRNALRTSRYIHPHLLNRCQITGFERDFLAVEFLTIHSLPIDYLKNHAAAQSPRLRLKPPYREHLSQAFARVFMRVGLPSDIPPFTKPKS